MEWQDFVENCPAATFFHTFDWYEIWKVYKGYDYQPIIIEFKSGSRVFLPLASFKILRGHLKRHVSSPAGTYGGFLFQKRLQEFEIQKLAHWIKGFDGINITFTPFHEADWGVSHLPSDFTQIIPLGQSWLRIEKQMKKGRILRKVRKAKSNYLEFRRIRAEEVVMFHKVYVSRRSDWEKPSNDYSLKLFELLHNVTDTDFWGIYLPDGTLIGGGIFLRQKWHVSSWLPVALTKYLSLKPYEFLFFNCIQYYHTKGLKWFDFNPSGGHEGVVRFKSGFGAVRKDVISWEHISVKVRMAETFNQLKSRFL